MFLKCSKSCYVPVHHHVGTLAFSDAKRSIEIIGHSAHFLTFFQTVLPSCKQAIIGAFFMLPSKLTNLSHLNSQVSGLLVL